nr:Eco47II family restriction endonuclease [Lelliottia steviae]
MQSNPTYVDLNDVYNVFIAGKIESNGITANSVIPLCRITWDSSNIHEPALKTFTDAVHSIIDGSKNVRSTTKPDPIAALLMNADLAPGDKPFDESDYRLFEQTRLADKWRGNRIGDLNELMACLLEHIKMSSSGKLDIKVSPKNGHQGVIAEFKNRFNTMNAASAIRTRQTMEGLIFQKNSEFYGYKAALVERIPKKSGEQVLFNPSNPGTGRKGEESEDIIRVGLQQFLAEQGDQLLYLKAIVIIALALKEREQLPEDYNMGFIFRLLLESIS